MIINRASDIKGFSIFGLPSGTLYPHILGSVSVPTPPPLSYFLLFPFIRPSILI